MTARRFDVLLLGATGITGSETLDYLVPRALELGLTVAVGARNVAKVRRQCAGRGVEAPPLVEVDVTDTAQVAAFAAAGSVLINLVGPYARSGESVVRACVAAGTSYLDLSAETQFIRRVDAAHLSAVDAGVAVVQTAGFEALPADLAVELARNALRRRGARLVSADVEVSVRSTAPAGLRDLLSGGTIQSILGVLDDPDDPALRNVAFRVPDESDALRIRKASPNRVRPRLHAGQIIAPMVPVAFLNPPVIHRSSWLLAQEANEEFVPLRYRDGLRFGRFTGVGGVPRLLAAGVLAGVQSLGIAASLLPFPFRRVLARAGRRVLPSSGSGPRGPQFHHWRWELDLLGRSDDHQQVHVRIEAEGHPGYVTTARMIAELALMIVDGSGSGRSGCITPALAAGADHTGRFARAGMRFSLSADQS
ncbi:saccharopine dehydrogenase NADP-binding domain-containing protein [Arthrobacter sp. Br18]|uniref:saccharopine dehydrogenase NADP-binding domain-containing protein n=1 Tax=Arthrobacter sp. Br18 TaxID=1312954 RepID=UPI00047A51A6|nr:saccharopine dehydrogenase NADP-binding domain-containing protein [Arthrobacter sp. Br18]